MSAKRIVVIGASAGGVAALEAVVRTLPPDFSAPVLIVLHVPATQDSLLPDILSNAGPLRATSALDREELCAGHIYVAPPDRHLMVDATRSRVIRGPKENHFRPSIDVLFRSAAYHYGSQAIGIVLTGSLRDGTSGLLAIRRLGGIAVVQHPDEAPYGAMPLSAMRLVNIDYALPVAEIGVLLERLVKQDPPDEPLDAAHYRHELKLDLDVAAAGPDFSRPTP